MPLSERTYDRKFYASAECWSLFEEVLAAEFQNPVLFGQAHQLTVDSYAVQHILHGTWPGSWSVRRKGSWEEDEREEAVGHTPEDANDASFWRNSSYALSPNL